MFIGKFLFHICINRLFSGKLCNTVGYFYESVFIFLSL